jgi:hypothetical protein
MTTPHKPLQLRLPLPQHVRLRRWLLPPLPNPQHLVLTDIPKLALVWRALVVHDHGAGALVAEVVARGAHVILGFLDLWQAEDLIRELEHEGVVDGVVGQVEEAVAGGGGVQGAGLRAGAGAQGGEVDGGERRHGEGRGKGGDAGGGGHCCGSVD